jgi:PAS domain S-box-containing protein
MVSQAMTKPPLYSPLIHPSAGLGLGFILLYGWAMLAPVFLAQIGAGLLCSIPGVAQQPILVVGLAAVTCIQSATAAALVRRFVRWPNPLLSATSILRFCLFAGPVACLIGPALGVPLLLVTGMVPLGTAPLNALMWWVSDALGVIVLAPLLFAFLAAPQEHWKSRRLTYALPIALTILVIGGVAELRDSLERERIDAAFSMRAERIAQSIQEELRDQQTALTTLSAQAQAGQLGGPVFQPIARHWLQHSRGLQAIAIAQQTPERRLRLVQAERQSNATVDWNIWLDDPRLLDAVQQSEAIQSAMTSGLLRIDPADSGAVFVVRALPAGSDGLGAVLILKLDLGALVAGATPEPFSEIHLCLRDQNQRDPLLAVLYQTQDCADPRKMPDALPMPLMLSSQLQLPSRLWELTLTPSEAFLAVTLRPAPLLAMFASMVSIALAAMLLLVITGQTNAMKLVVQSRTAALRKQLEKSASTATALRRSESNWRRMVEMMPVGMVYLKLDGTLRAANPSACRLLGYQHDELENMPIYRLFDEQQLRVVAKDFDTMMANHHSIWQGERSVIRKDGSVLAIHAHMILLRNKHGEPSMALTVFFDITAQRELLAATQARELAEKANAAKSQFLSSMSHELRTPLNALLGFSQLMRSDTQHPLPPHQAQRLAYIEQAGWHLLRMIGDVLDLARLEGGHLSVKPVAGDLSQVIHECVQMMSYELESRGITLQLTLPETPIHAVFDPLRIKQVLLNLLSNAIKYNKPEGRVELSAFQDPGEVHVLVADTGIGISSEQQRHLFEPFNRLDQTSSSEPGTGIGLVISRYLVQGMGGQLHVGSELGQGTTVSIVLSAASADQLIDLDDRQKHRQHDQQNHPAHDQNQ